MYTESKPISDAFPLARSILKWGDRRLSTRCAQVAEVARARPVIDALYHTLSYVQFLYTFCRGSVVAASQGELYRTPLSSLKTEGMS